MCFICMYEGTHCHFSRAVDSHATFTQKEHFLINFFNFKYSGSFYFNIKLTTNPNQSNNFIIDPSLNPAPLTAVVKPVKFPIYYNTHAVYKGNGGRLKLTGSG